MLRLILCLTFGVSFAVGDEAQSADLILSPQAILRDCSECPEMVVVPAGRYVIGASDEETLRENMYSEGLTAAGSDSRGEVVVLTREAVAAREKPQTKITISQPFAIGRYEVTVDQYATFVEATGHESASSCRVYNEDGSVFIDTEGLTWRNPGFAQSGSSPVVCINWFDAIAYVSWITEITGQFYRLPSEAEWEYAARSGTSTARYWGDGVGDACLYANVGDLDMADAFDWRNREFSCRDGYTATSPVGRFEPNQWGLNDVLGNVWEYVSDCWHDTHAGRPVDASPRGGDYCDTIRMTKGGSWSHYPWGIRSAVRNRAPLEASYNTTGLRLARDLVQHKER